MKKNIFYYSGFTQFENTGDLLINKTLIELLCDKGTLFIDDSRMPVAYREELLQNISDLVKTSELPKKNFSRRILKELIKNVYSRGNNIYILDNPGHHISILNKPNLNLYKNNFKMYLFKVLGAKRLKIGVTLGPFSESVSVFFSKQSKLYKAILVRDIKSFELANTYKFKNVSLIPDLAWAYNHELFSKSPIFIKEKKYIVLSFRDNLVGKETDFNYFEGIISNVSSILKNNLDYKIIFSYQVTYDKRSCSYFYNLYKDNYDVEFIDRSLSINEALSLYSNAEMVISNRLHVLLLAIKVKTLPLAITQVDKHHKLVSMFYDEQLYECVLDINLEGFSFSRLINNKNEILMKLENITKNNIELIKDGVNNIFITN